MNYALFVLSLDDWNVAFLSRLGPNWNIYRHCFGLYGSPFGLLAFDVGDLSAGRTVCVWLLQISHYKVDKITTEPDLPWFKIKIVLWTVRDIIRFMMRIDELTFWHFYYLHIWYFERSPNISLVFFLVFFKSYKECLVFIIVPWCYCECGKSVKLSFASTFNLKC